MSDQFIVEADSRVVGIAGRAPGGFRFFTSDPRFKSLEIRTHRTARSLVRRAEEIVVAARDVQLGSKPVLQ